MQFFFLKKDREPPENSGPPYIYAIFETYSVLHSIGIGQQKKNLGINVNYSSN